MRNKIKISTVFMLTLLLFGVSNCNSKKESGIVDRIEQLEKDNQLIVQLAALEIDETQLAPYLQLLQEGIKDFRTRRTWGSIIVCYG